MDSSESLPYINRMESGESYFESKSSSRSRSNPKSDRAAEKTVMFSKEVEAGFKSKIELKLNNMIDHVKKY